MSFPHFPPPPMEEKGGGGASGCLMLSCQLGLNHDMYKYLSKGVYT